MKVKGLLGVLLSVYLLIDLVLFWVVGYVLCVLCGACRGLSHKMNLFVHKVLFYYPLCCVPSWTLDLSKPTLPNQPKLILVSNHFSLLDSPVVCSYLVHGGYRVIFVGRSGQDRIPFVGWALKRLGHIFIQFEEGNKALGKSVRSAFERLDDYLTNDEKVAVVFFGTGLFQRPSESPLNYKLKNGPFRLAIEKGLGVVPVWIQGTDEGFPASNVVLPARLSVSVGSPIFPHAQAQATSLEDMKTECTIQMNHLRNQSISKKH
eukprot:TRINITY_DN4712_c0_g1_i1.p1 TRINITY_DN4712_c0_g1~~TRINITY_DN4712_c0_g1_i1.p1  ORF type:complete len:262 (-),score=37.01 TRINITY_DN4712_c0_g1_i1:956-1741(-)